MGCPVEILRCHRRNTGISTGGSTGGTTSGSTDGGVSGGSTGGDSSGGTDGGATGGTTGESSDIYTCDHHLNLTDDYGDGWDNSYLQIYVDGIPTDTYTNVGQSAQTVDTQSFSVNLVQGSTFGWVYNSGSP